MKRRQFIKNSAVGGGLFLGAAPWDALSAAPLNFESLRNGPASRSDSNDTRYCQIKKYNNQNTLFLSGRPQFALTYYSQVFDKGRYQNMRKHGVAFFGVYISLGDRHETGYTNGKVRLHRKGIWDHPGKVDFETFDTAISEVLSAVPDAYLILKIGCNSPCWWDSYHPAETCRTYQSMLPMRQSFSSEVWRKETAEVLRRIVAHTQASVYRSNIVGIDILFGESNDGTSFGWLGAGDYSHAARDSFRSWLKGRYGDNLQQSSKYFDRPVDQLDMPTPDALMKSVCGDFLDPQESILSLEYRVFRGMEIVESLDYLCDAVKKESKGNLLAGGTYGSVFRLSYDQMAMSKALTRKSIDFLSCSGWQTVPGALQKSGKIFYHHSTLTTPLSKSLFESYPEASPYGDVIMAPEGKKQMSMEEALESLKYEFAKAVVTGSIHTVVDSTGGAFDNDYFLSLFAAMQRIGDAGLHRPRKSVSEICVIVNENSFIYHGPLAKNQVYQNLVVAHLWVSRQMEELDRIGAPYDVHLQSDLESLDVADYKMFVFLNPAVLNQSDRENIKRSCMRDNRTLLWLYAPGYVGNEIAIGNIASLLGMKVKEEKKAPPSKVVVKTGHDELTYDAAEVSPFITIDDSQVKPFGFSGSGSLVLAEKKAKDYTNVLATVPPLPWKVVQFFAERSNVHIYEKDGGTILANEGFLAIRKTTGAEAIINMPQKCTYTDVLSSVNSGKVSKRINSGGENRIHLRFRQGETVKLLFIESR